jgi:alkanesulfonate monooxygenase SsuD/methylene tetrahydromethanopterin reductase-like flavin-dependent oxidoreductase (luciferase family)
VWALAADSVAEALRLMASRELWRVNLDKGGVRDPLASPEQAAAYPYTEADRVLIKKIRNKAFAGTANEVASKLQALAAELQLDEIVINTWTYDEIARERSYRLLAQALGLVPQSLSPA